MVASAIAHWVSAGEHDRAYELLQAEFGRIYLNDGPLAAALIAAVSAADATLDAGRMVTLGSALALVGALTPAEAWLQRAERRADDLDTTGRTRLTAAQALLAVQQGNARRALDLLDGFDPQGSDDRVVMASPAFAIFPRGWLHDFRGARGAAARTRTLRSPGVIFDEVTVPGALSWVACLEGSLREADELAEKALATALEFALADHPTLVDPLRTRGRLCFERGDLTGAEVALKHSMMLAEKSRRSFALVTTATLARVQMSQGRVSDAKGARRRRTRISPARCRQPVVHPAGRARCTDRAA